MKKATEIYNNNKKLFSFIGLSYFDKMIIFLLPLIVLKLFNDKSVYLSIEYIYSIVMIIVPFLDLGLGGYFFYLYRNKENRRKVVANLLKIFHLLFVAVFALGIIFIIVHYLIFPFEEYIVFIVFRSIFILTFTFLTSYYRLVNRPQKALFVTILANFISLMFVFVYYFSNEDFNLWLVFIGQILFCIFYFFKTLKRLLFKWVKSYHNVEALKVIKKSIAFSWPTIIQVFIIMYVGNYGKINALEKLTVDEGFLLSFTQRFSMLIQLTHGAIIGFLMKDIFVSGNLLVIQKKILIKYFGLLLSALFCVIVIIIGSYYLLDSNYELSFLIQNVCLIIGHTFFWCVFSYFEVYYSRENKNIIKLYLALVNGLSFILIFNLLNIGYLERITLSMFASTLLTLITSLIVLKKRGYQLN